MSENDKVDQPTDLPIPDEMTILRERAKTLGIRVGPNIGIDSLRKRIQDKLDGKEDSDSETEETVEEKTEKTTKVDKKETIGEKVKRLRMKHLKLVRVRIVCMNPSKKEMTGEIITIANKYIGKVSKFVPFDLEEPYHIPHVIYKELKSRKYVNVKSVMRNGVEVTQPESMREVPEFSIEVLPPLTEKELNNLRISQARSGSTVGE